MPNRVIRDWTDSETVNNLTVYGERFFTRLIMKADDYGRFTANVKLLKSHLFPLLLDNIREADISRWMAECQKAGLIVLYEVQAKPYLQIENFNQRLRQKIPKYPCQSYDGHVTVNGQSIDGLNPESGIQNPETRINTGAATPPTVTKKIVESKKFSPPMLDDVKRYFLSTIGDPKNAKCWPEDRCMNQAGMFWDHYHANGWVQGRGKPIKDWQAACRNWIRNGIKGTFDHQQQEFKKPDPKPPDLKPKLEKIQVDINYLYERICEDESFVTVISTDPAHYDYLKNKGMATFSNEQVQQIREQATAHAQSNGKNDQDTILHYMKRVGVVEILKRIKQQAWETVFYVDG